MELLYLMGTVRFALAMLVVYFHVDGYANFGLRLPSSLTAVQLFYVISGFYMALVLNEKYTTPRMNWTFYSNRFFRLWPPMMVVAAVTVLSFLLLDEVLLFRLRMDLDEFLDYLGALPSAAVGYIILTNLVVFGQSWMWFLRFDPGEGVSWSPAGIDEGHNGSSFLINHPTFTVAIEATYYLISPFLLRRSVRWAVAVAVAGFLYHVAIYLAGLQGMAWSYFFVGSAAYFYFLGACAYHAYVYLSRLPPGEWWWLDRFELALYPLALGVVAAATAWGYLPEGNFALAMVLALVIPLLFRRTKRSRLDRIVGDLSYGIYLIHYPLYLLLLKAFDGRTAAALTLILVIVGAIALYLSVETPLDRWRQRRARAAAAAAVMPRAGAARQDVRKAFWTIGKRSEL